LAACVALKNSTWQLKAICAAWTAILSASALIPVVAESRREIAAGCGEQPDEIARRGVQAEQGYQGQRERRRVWDAYERHRRNRRRRRHRLA
jgi:hypothetical protein